MDTFNSDFSKLSMLDFAWEKTMAAAAEKITATSPTASSSFKDKPTIAMLKTRSKAKKALQHSKSKHRRKNDRIRGRKIVPSHDEGIKRAVVRIIYYIYCMMHAYYKYE